MKNERRQQVLESSRVLFLRYGFRKVTLSDIAKEVGVSRPTLYQVFSNKEEIFKAIIEEWQADSLRRIRAGIDAKASTEKKLLAAIEIWLVEPFEMLKASPSMEEFQDSSLCFTGETVDKGYAEFESILKGVLAKGDHERRLTDAKLARLMVVYLRGLKIQASDLKELRGQIKSLLDLALK